MWKYGHFVLLSIRVNKSVFCVFYCFHALRSIRVCMTSLLSVIGKSSIQGLLIGDNNRKPLNVLAKEEVTNCYQKCFTYLVFILVAIFVVTLATTEIFDYYWKNNEMFSTYQRRFLAKWFDLRLTEKTQLDFFLARYVAVFYFYLLKDYVACNLCLEPLLTGHEILENWLRNIDNYREKFMQESKLCADGGCNILEISLCHYVTMSLSLCHYVIMSISLSYIINVSGYPWQSVK